MTDERERRSILISEEHDGERVDSALAKILELSRSTVADLLNAGEVLQGKKPLSKSDRVQPGDRLTVLMPAIFDPLELKATPIEELDIVYDDDDVVVVNKPVGCAAHASPGWTGPTVVGALIARGYRISTSGPQERQGIVQRLDAGTSGLMLLAKNETSYNNMKNQFRNRTVKKVYHTLVQGHIDPSEGTIDRPHWSTSARGLSIRCRRRWKTKHYALLTHRVLLERFSSQSRTRDGTHPSDSRAFQCATPPTCWGFGLRWRSSFSRTLGNQTSVAPCDRAHLQSTHV